MTVLQLVTIGVLAVAGFGAGRLVGTYSHKMPHAAISAYLLLIGGVVVSVGMWVLSWQT